MPEITQAEAKKAVEDIKVAFEEFKKTNDARIEALKADKGVGELETKLQRINDAMDKSEKLYNAFRDQQEKIEAKVNRLATLGGAGSGEGDDAEKKAKRQAWQKFLRRGEQKMSEAELKMLDPSSEGKALVESGDITGGYLAPPQFANEIVKAVVLFSPMRQLVNVVTIGAAEYIIPKRTQTASATRVGESGTRAETQNPNWGAMKVPAPEMYAEARCTWANLEDSAFNLEQLLQGEFSEQFGVKEGQEVISGNGINQMLGFLDANAAGVGVPIAYTPSTTAATIAAGAGAQADPLIDFFHAVKTAYAVRGTWVFNRATLGKIRKLKDTTGQYLWQAGGSSRGGVGEAGVAALPPATILGAPYVECPDMPDEAANAFPIAFGDWKRAYTMVERIDMAIVRDPFTAANVGQVKFFARRRVGGQVVLGEAIRLYKCAVS